MMFARRKTARHNKSITASVLKHDIEHPFAEGNFCYAVIGMYNDGPRRGKRCVCKWFKGSCPIEENDFYLQDIVTNQLALDIITKWNMGGYFKKHIIRINIAEVWLSGDGRKFLQEPFIDDYQKFNSNTGWVSQVGSDWGNALQALSHFSYHISGGQFLLCDLQGGIKNNVATLTDPVIMSQKTGQYGPTDLGKRGITTFFKSHVCNEYCKRWKKPVIRGQFLPRHQGTSMTSVGVLSSSSRRVTLPVVGSPHESPRDPDIPLEISFCVPLENRDESFVSERLEI